MVTGAAKRSFTMEWKMHWGHFEKFASKKHPMDKRCPKGHYRVDVEVGAISTTQVSQALHCYTRSRAFEERRSAPSI